MKYTPRSLAEKFADLFTEEAAEWGRLRGVDYRMNGKTLITIEDARRLLERL